jgi:excisionase family DNA binding protein
MAKLEDFTIREAAKRLDLTLNYLYQLVWSGKLAAHRRDGRWSIPAEAIEGRLRIRTKVSHSRA